LPTPAPIPPAAPASAPSPVASPAPTLPPEPAPIAQTPMPFAAMPGIWHGRAALDRRGMCDLSFELRETDPFTFIVWYRYMKPRLEALGLGWANFQAMRRTHASLGHEAGIDPKVSADQRGHGIGVALDVYTHSSVETRRGAAEKLERSVLPFKGKKGPEAA
jgi:hypothetical protein